MTDKLTDRQTNTQTDTTENNITLAALGVIATDKDNDA